MNVSARQLAEPGFADMVAAALAETGLPASLPGDRGDRDRRVRRRARRWTRCTRCDRLGVRIALDDFGTGHSSLGLLQTVPVDILKVDKSFVDSIALAGRHAVIATALIDVSDGLGLTAVAEGVETAEQAAELYRLGYRYAQGYHFGRPVAQATVRAGVGGGLISTWAARPARRRARERRRRRAPAAPTTGTGRSGPPRRARWQPAPAGSSRRRAAACAAAQR